MSLLLDVSPRIRLRRRSSNPSHILRFHWQGIFDTPHYIDHLSTILPQALRRRGLADQALAALVCHRATAWIGKSLPEAAAYLRVRGLHENTLMIAFRHSAAGEACRQRLPELEKHLSSSRELPPIKEIRLVRAN